MIKDTFKQFLEENHFKVMYTDDTEGKMVATRYYINPFGEIGYKHNGTFKYLNNIQPDKDGYRRMGFNIAGDIMNKFVHRLVGQNFVGNPDDYPCVNHKNNVITDNNASNLEWGTNTQNNRHRNIKGKDYDKEIVQIKVLDGNHCRIVGEYHGRKDLPKMVDTSEKKVDRQYIYACCRHYKYKKSYRKYVWLFKDELNDFLMKNRLTLIN